MWGPDLYHVYIMHVHVSVCVRAHQHQCSLQGFHFLIYKIKITPPLQSSWDLAIVPRTYWALEKCLWNKYVDGRTNVTFLGLFPHSKLAVLASQGIQKIKGYQAF